MSEMIRRFESEPLEELVAVGRVEVLEFAGERRCGRAVEDAHVHRDLGRTVLERPREEVAERVVRALFEEVAFVAYHFGWDHRDVLEMPHWERRRWCEEISRINVGGGWFMTPNVLTKVEYVTSSYDGAGFSGSKFAGAEYSGLMLEAVIGF